MDWISNDINRRREIILILLLQVFFVIFKTPGVSLALLPIVRLIRSYAKLTVGVAGVVLKIFPFKMLFSSKLGLLTDALYVIFLIKHTIGERYILPKYHNLKSKRYVQTMS